MEGWRLYALKHQSESDISHGNRQIARRGGKVLVGSTIDTYGNINLGFVRVVVTLISRKSGNP